MGHWHANGNFALYKWYIPVQKLNGRDGIITSFISAVSKREKLEKVDLKGGRGIQYS